MIQSKKNKTSLIDVHIGTRLRLRRTMLKMSQKNLASLIGVTFQQIQKYENGTNKISVSRLYLICLALNIPIEFFFQGIKELSPRILQNKKNRQLKINDDTDSNPMHSTQTLHLINAFWKINNKKVHKHLLSLIIGMSDHNKIF